MTSTIGAHPCGCPLASTETPRAPVTHEAFIHRVRAIVAARLADDPTCARLLDAKLVYGSGVSGGLAAGLSLGPALAAWRGWRTAFVGLAAAVAGVLGLSASAARHGLASWPTPATGGGGIGAACLACGTVCGLSPFTGAVADRFGCACLGPAGFGAMALGWILIARLSPLPLPFPAASSRPEGRGF